MGCGSCGPELVTGAPTCCGLPMKETGDRFVCSVSGSHTLSKPGGCC